MRMKERRTSRKKPIPAPKIALFHKVKQSNIVLLPSVVWTRVPAMHYLHCMCKHGGRPGLDPHTLAKEFGGF